MLYVALLRGVNVGGKNRLPMAELRALLDGLGFGPVRTYIQSGNVLLESDLPEDALRALLQREILKRFGIDSAPVLRTREQLQALVSALPFTEDQVEAARACDPEVEHLYVALLNEPPALACMDAPGEALRVVGRDAYLLLDHSVRFSKLAARPGDGTTRNWNTILKLHQLAGG